MMVFFPVIVLSLVATLLTAPAKASVTARSFEGVVSHVTDGDTLWVRPASGAAPQAVRLQGIDAPEICQPHGAQARDALVSRALHQPVTVDTRASDSYRRVLARVNLSGGDSHKTLPGEPDLGAWLVSRGHAWSARFHGHPGPYSAQEAQARSSRRGLWTDGVPVEPREFRKAHGGCR